MIFLQLPCAIDIIKHPREIEGKSTAIHAAIIAPTSVNIYIYPDIPNYDTYEEKVRKVETYRVHVV